MSPRPLLVTSDADLLDEVLRLAELAGAEVEVVPDVAGARPRWIAAPVVLVGHDALAAALRARLPRRAGVVLLGGDLDDASVWQSAVELGAEQVVFLPDAEPWLRDALADAVDGEPSPAPVVAVVGGRGGAGATVLAAALAVADVRRGGAPLLLDADPLGGGVDLAFGAEGDSGLRWSDLATTRGRLPAGALAAALPRAAGVTLLSWDRGPVRSAAPEAVASVLAAGRRAHRLVVADVSRAPDDAGRVVLAESAVTLLVVPSDVRAVAAAGRVAASVGLTCRDLQAVVRTGPRGLSAEGVASHLGLPLAGGLPEDRQVDRDVDRGLPPGTRAGSALARFCDRLLEDLAPVATVAGGEAA